jgi:hypothetical protein
VLCRLGAAAPKKTFMGSDPCNLKGLFEALALATAHDAFLGAAGSCWHDWRRFDLQSVHPDTVVEHAARMRQVLIDEFEDERLILVKDPRICRFVPFTLSILDDLDIRPVAVLPLRDPLEVALSLKRRNDFDVAKSIMLWLRHVLDAEYHSRGLARAFSSYQALLEDWRRQADLISEKTGVMWRYSDGAVADVEDFLTTELYHERAVTNDPADDRELLELAPRVHRILLEVCARGEAPDLLDRLDDARAEFDAYCRGFAAAGAR